MQAKINSEQGTQDKNFNFNLRWDHGAVISIGPNASLEEAAQLMKEHQVGNVLVMDSNAVKSEVQGIVTDRDIALSLAGEEDIQDLRVVDIMSGNVVCASENDDFFKLVNLMSESGVTRLPLKSADGKVVGVVNAKNLLEILTKSLFELTKISEKQQENEQIHQH
jgi:signal-transduction protein with cAMP-binding, CBS, and nucleotidyltransferase domain